MSVQDGTLHLKKKVSSLVEDKSQLLYKIQEIEKKNRPLQDKNRKFLEKNLELTKTNQNLEEDIKKLVEENKAIKHKLQESTEDGDTAECEPTLRQELDRRIDVTQLAKKRHKKAKSSSNKVAGVKETFFGYDEDSASIASEQSSLYTDVESEIWDEVGVEQYEESYKRLSCEQLHLQRSYSVLQSLYGGYTDPQREVKTRADLENDLIIAQGKIDDLEHMLETKGQGVVLVKEKQQLAVVNRALSDKVKVLGGQNSTLQQDLSDSQEQKELLEFRLLELEESNNVLRDELIARDSPTIDVLGLPRVMEVNVSQLVQDLYHIKYTQDSFLTEDEKQSIITVQGFIANVGKELEDLRTAHKSLQDRFTQVEGEKVDLLSAATGVSSDIIIEYEETRNSLMEANIKIKEMEHKICELKKTGAIHKYTEDFNTKHETRYRKEISELQRKLSSAMEGHGYEMEYYNDKELQLKTAKQRIIELEKEMKAKCDELSKELKTKDTHMDDLKQENMSLKQQIQENLELLEGDKEYSSFENTDTSLETKSLNESDWKRQYDLIKVNEMQLLEHIRDLEGKRAILQQQLEEQLRTAAQTTCVLDDLQREVLDLKDQSADQRLTEEALGEKVKLLQLSEGKLHDRLNGLTAVDEMLQTLDVHGHSDIEVLCTKLTHLKEQAIQDKVVVDLKETVTELTRSKTELEEQVDSLDKELKNLYNTNAVLNDKVQHVSTQNKDTENTCVNLKEKLKQAEIKIDEQSPQNQNKTEQSSKEASTTLTLERRLLESKEDNECVIKNAEAIEKHYEKESKKLKQKNKELLKKQHEQINELKDRASECYTLKEHVNQLQRSLQDDQDKFNEEKKMLNEEHKATLEQLQRAQYECNSVQKQFDELKIKTDETKDRFQTDISRLQEVTEQKNREISRLQSEVKEVNTKLHDMEPVEGMLELRDRMENLLTQYKTQIEDLTKQLELKTTELQDATDRLNDLQSKDKARDAMIEDMTKQNQSKTKELNNQIKLVEDYRVKERTYVSQIELLRRQLHTSGVARESGLNATNVTQLLTINSDNTQLLAINSDNTQLLTINSDNTQLLATDSDNAQLLASVSDNRQVLPTNNENTLLFSNVSDNTQLLAINSESRQLLSPTSDNTQLLATKSDNTQLLSAVSKLQAKEKKDRDTIQALETRLSSLHGAIETIVRSSNEDTTEAAIQQAVCSSIQASPGQERLDRVNEVKQEIHNKYKDSMLQLEADYMKHVRQLELHIGDLEAKNLGLENEIKEGERETSHRSLSGVVNSGASNRVLELEVQERVLSLKVKELENNCTELTERLATAQKQGRPTEIHITRDRAKEDLRREEIESLHHRIRDLESAENSFSDQIRESQNEDREALKHRIWELEKTEKALKRQLEFYQLQRDESLVSIETSMMDTPEDILRQKVLELDKMEIHLKQQIGDLEHDREELHNIARKDKGLIHELNVTVRELSLREKNLKDHISRFEVNEDLLYNKIDDLEDLLQEYENQLKTKTSKEAELSANVQDLTLHERALQTKIQILEENAAVLRSSELELKKASRILEDERDHLQTEVDSSTTRVRQLETSELSFRQKLRSTESEQVVSQGRIIQLECSDNASRERVQHLESCNDNLSKKLYCLEEEKAHSMFELSETKQLMEEFENEKSKHKKSEDGLREQIAKMESSERSLKRKLSECDGKDTRQCHQISSMEKTIASLNDKLRKLEQDNSKLNMKINELNSSLIITQQKLEAANDVNCSNKGLQDDITQKQKTIRQLEERVAELHHKINVNKYSNLSGSTVQISKHHLSDLKAQAALLEESEANLNRLERLERHLRQAIDDLRSGKDACGHDGEIKDLKEEINRRKDASKEHVSLRKSYQELSDRYHETHEQLKDVENKEINSRKELIDVKQKAHKERMGSSSPTGHCPSPTNMAVQSVLSTTQHSPRLAIHRLNTPRTTTYSPEILELVKHLPMGDLDLHTCQQPGLGIEAFEHSIKQTYYKPVKLDVTYIGKDRLTLTKVDSSRNRRPHVSFEDDNDDVDTPRHKDMAHHKDMVHQGSTKKDTTPYQRSSNTPVSPSKPPTPTKPATPLWLRHQLHQEIREEEWLDIEKSYRTEIKQLKDRVEELDAQLKVKESEIEKYKNKKEEQSKLPKRTRDQERQFEIQTGLNQDLQNKIKNLQKMLLDKELKLRELQVKSTSPDKEASSVSEIKRKWLAGTGQNDGQNSSKPTHVHVVQETKPVQAHVDNARLLKDKDDLLKVKEAELERLRSELRLHQERVLDRPTDKDVTIQLLTKDNQVETLKKEYYQLKSEYEILKASKESLSEPKMGAQSPESDLLRQTLQKQVLILKNKLKDKYEEARAAKKEYMDTVTTFRARIARFKQLCKQKDTYLKMLLKALRQLGMHHNTAILSEIENHLKNCSLEEYTSSPSKIDNRKTTTITLNGNKTYQENGLSNGSHSSSKQSSHRSHDTSHSQSYNSEGSHDSYDSDDSSYHLNNEVSVKVNGRHSTATHKPTEYYRVVTDYNPANFSQSGRQNLEIALKEGDRVKVLGTADSTGYYEAECNGQVGLVPKDYLVPIAAHVLLSSQLGRKRRTQSGYHKNRSPEEILEMYGHLHEVSSTFKG